jgi:hypothetical protein
MGANDVALVVGIGSGPIDVLPRWHVTEAVTSTANFVFLHGPRITYGPLSYTYV